MHRLVIPIGKCVESVTVSELPCSFPLRQLCPKEQLSLGKQRQEREVR